VSGEKLSRWTFEVPIEKCMPRGPKEAGMRAVKRLGPFQHTMQKDAEERGPRTAWNGRIAVSQELAVEKVNSLAMAYLENVERSKGAPRLKHVLQNFEALHEIAGLLATLLEQTDDFTRSYLRTAGSGISGHIDHFPPPMMEAADVKGLPPIPAANETSPSWGEWVSRLRALQDYLEYSLGTLVVAKGVTDLERPDKGGSSDLYKYLYGTAQWNLVKDGRFAFEMFKPGQTKGTEGGEFHLFVQDIFEFATGEDPETESKLLPQVKQVAKSYRQLDVLTAEELGLIEEESELDHKQLGAKEYLRRVADIQQREAMVFQKKYDLWAELYPYTYGRRKAG